MHARLVGIAAGLGFVVMSWPKSAHEHGLNTVRLTIYQVPASCKKISHKASAPLAQVTNSMVTRLLITESKYPMP